MGEDKGGGGVDYEGGWMVGKERGVSVYINPIYRVPSMWRNGNAACCHFHLCASFVVYGIRKYMNK